jgi:hypothetical protein
LSENADFASVCCGGSGLHRPASGHRGDGVDGVKRLMEAGCRWCRATTETDQSPELLQREADRSATQCLSRPARWRQGACGRWNDQKILRRRWRLITRSGLGFGGRYWSKIRSQRHIEIRCWRQPRQLRVLVRA